MKYEQPHIVIQEDLKGEISIQIDDYELFDFIEDYLIEKCSIEYACMGEKNEAGHYVMYFLDKYSFETLRDAIHKLDKNEIEKIYKLNN